MRNATRRKQPIWFVSRTRDDSGIEPVYVYGKPEMHRFSVSSTSGSPIESTFGILPSYDRYIISYDRKFKPVEGMYLYVDKTPELDGEYLAVDEDGELVTKPEYILDKIYDTQKGILARYGIKKVSDSDA